MTLCEVRQVRYATSNTGANYLALQVVQYLLSGKT